jgi:hypothetical protein
MSNVATPNLYKLARRLVEYQAGSGKGAASKDDGAFRVCEQLRIPLGRLVGLGGFRSLLGRALVLASAKNSSLGGLRIEMDGSLAGVGDLEAELDRGEIALAQVLLVTQLLGLLVTFIGAALTQQLLHEIWPDMDELTL